MKQKLLWLLFAIMIIINPLAKVAAQTNAAGQLSISVPPGFAACNTDTVCVKVFNNKSVKGVTYTGPVKLVVTVPGAALMTYKGLTAASAANAGITNVAYNAGTGKLTADITLPALGANTELCFLIQPDCNIGTLTPLPVFLAEATYPTGYPDAFQNLVAATANVTKGALAATGSPKLGGIYSNSIAAFGSQGDPNYDGVSVTNSGFGDIQEVVVKTTIPNKFTTAPVINVWDANYLAPVGLATLISQTTNGDGSVTYLHKISGANLGADNVLTPGEGITWSVNFKAPAECIQGLFKYEFSFTCGDGLPACDPPVKYNSTRTVVDTSPNIAELSRVYDIAQNNGCNDFKPYSGVFKNYAPAPVGAYPAVSGVGYDVIFGSNFGGGVTVKNLTFNGFAINPLDAKIIIGSSLNNITSFEVSFKDMNTNPAYGLIDIDGDGFLDDYPGQLNLPFSMEYSLDLTKGCTGGNWYIFSFIRYKDICRTDKIGYIGPYDYFGLERVSPTKQTSSPAVGSIAANGVDQFTPYKATFDFNNKAFGSFSTTLANSPTKTAQLKIRQSERVELVRTSVKLNGTTLVFNSSVGAGSSDAVLTTALPGFAVGTPSTTTDSDSVLIFDVPVSMIPALFDGTLDNLEYDLQLYNCATRQNTTQGDSWSLCVKFADCGAAGGGEVDLGCKQPLALTINRGCGVKPCYKQTVSIGRVNPKGFTAVNETTPIGVLDFDRAYECDTLLLKSSFQLNGDGKPWFMEPNGFYTQQGYPGAEGRYTFSLVYPTTPAAVDAQQSPFTFIENESKICLYKKTSATDSVLVKEVSLTVNDFAANTWINKPAIDQNFSFYAAPYIYPPADGLAICAGGNYPLLCAKGTLGGYYYNGATSMNGFTLFTVNKDYAMNSYILLPGRALYNAGVTDKIWNDSSYIFIFKLKWKPKDTHQEWGNQVFVDANYLDHIGNYYNYDQLGQTTINNPETTAKSNSYFGACAGGTALVNVFAKDLTVENPNAVYQLDCSAEVCNKFYFDSYGDKGAGQGYFEGGEVRVPYKLTNLKATLPAGLEVVGNAILTVNTGCTTSTFTLTPSATTGAVTFTNTDPLARMDDCAGKTTAYQLCYTVKETSGGGTLAGKIFTVANFLEEINKPYVLKDTASVSAVVPDLVLKALTTVLNNTDGGTCEPASYDFMVFNNGAGDAKNVHFVVDNGGDVSPIVSITDKVGAIDSVKNYVSGTTGKIAYIGKIAAGDSLRITVKGNTTLCNGTIKVLVDWGCNYPALASSDIVSIVAASAHEDVVTAIFEATPPKLMSKPLVSPLRITELCATQDIVIEVRNADLPNILKLGGQITIPASMSIVGPLEVKYPTSGAFTAAGTISAAGVIDLTGVAPFSPGCGLVGVDTLAKASIQLKFKVAFAACPTTNSEEIKYSFTGENYCGKKATTFGVIQVLYIGTGGNTNTYKVSGLAQSLKICAGKNETQPLTETLTVTNLGGGGAPSTTVANIDSMTVSMPFNSTQMAAANFVLGAPFVGTPITLDAAGNPSFKIAVPAGVAVGGTFTIPITFDITPKVDKLCEVTSIPPFCFFSEFTSRVPLVCTENPLLQCTKFTPVLSKGAELVTKTFECCYVSIGSTVFDDKANNGVQDGTDAGIVGATVNLYGDSNGDGLITGTELTVPIATTTTGTDGKYLFDELFKGPYIVGVVPTAAIPTSSTLTVTGDDGVDKDDNGTQVTPSAGNPTPEARSGVITLTPEAEPFGATESDVNGGQDDALLFGGDKSGDMTVDFGFFTPYSIGSVAFIDADNDGVKDAGELPLAGLTVTLYDGLGNVITTTTTASDGTYAFNGLGEGDYKVGVQPNATQTLASTTVDASSGATSVDDKNKGTQTAISNESLSAIVKLGPGLQPSGEAGIGSTTTGINKSTSTDANTNSTLDFGFLAPMSIGSTAFNDKNNNGIQDPTELGIPNLVVNLYNGTSPTGAAIATTTTDANGNYVFENLVAGNYIVGVLPDATAPKTSTGGTLGSDNQVDADNNGTQPGGPLNEARSGVINLTQGAEPTASSTETALGLGKDQDAGALTDPNGDMTVDFGFFTPYSIGSNVFVDANNDGTKGLGEAGIPNLLVTLYKADGITVVATTTTGADGSYVFNNLGEGDFKVGVKPNTTQTLASGTTPTGDDANKGTQTAVSGESISAVVTLGPTLQPTGETGAGTSLSTATDANTNSTIDFGFLAPMSIGSTAFDDKNNNGKQDAGEAGISSLAVTLYAADGTTVIATTTTNGTGDYIFENLQPGSYVVGIKPNTTQPTSSTPAADGDTQTDGNDNGTQGASGTEAKSGVIVLALNSEPTATETAITGGTQDDANALADNNGDMTVDFGFFTPLSVGSVAFVDANNDGTKGPGEAGIPGLLVTLYGSDGTTVVATTTTGPDGSYVFNNLGEGTYSVGVKPNTTQTLASGTTPAGDDGNKGTQTAVALESKSAPFTLTPGTQPTGETGTGTSLSTSLDENTNSTIDFGFLAPMSIGSTAFNDKNNDGIQAATGELGIPNLAVTLYAADGTTVVATTTTDVNGDYIFENLQPGSYVVGIKPNTTQPTSSTPAADGDTQTDGNDNGTQPSQGAEAKSGVIVLALNGEPTTTETAQGAAQDNANALADQNGDMTVDFGFFTPYSIGSNVFVDADNDGVKDAGEPGIPGLVVTLYKEDGVTVVATTTTGPDGSYVFNNLGEGKFVVGVKPNTTQTLASTSTPGGDDANAGTQPAIAAESKSGVVTLGPGSQPINETGAGTGLTTSKDENTNSTIDFGFLAPMSIGSTAFDDKNNDGIQGAGEAGIPNLLVTLYKADGTTVVATTTTSVTGDYIFKNVEPGSYVVGVTPSAAKPTSSTPAADGDTAVDSNDNGTQPAITMAGQTPEAKSSVIVLTLNGEVTAEPGQGGGQDDGALTDVNGNMTVDFGFFTPYSIGSNVFNDANNDGVKNPGEAGIPGLLVTLFGADGTTVVATTTTGADGSYVFNNLGEGTFTVGVTPNAGIPKASTTVDPTTGLASVDDKNDGTQAGGIGTISKSSPIVLGPGTQPSGETGTGTSLTTSKDENTNSAVDFGFYVPLSIGSTVFLDTNNNGKQDAGEPGLSGQMVTLYRADGTTVVATTTTGANGEYIFNNLGQGSYVVGVKPVGDASVSSDDIATTPGDNQTDGDDNGTQTIAGGESKSSPIALKAGAEPTDATGTEASSNGMLDNAKDADGDMTVDFGFFVPAKLSNLVFQDLNKDGKQDLGEPGIGGVVVKLYDGEGNLVHSTITDPNGEYIFENLRPGIPYTVKFTVPAGYTVSPSNVGGDDAIDSDGGPAVGGISSTGTYILSSGEDNKTADLGLFKTAALPLNLISFVGERASTQVNLTWKTANEVDFSHYEVQRSLNAKEFNSIGKVNGTNDKFYTLADTKPVVGNNYYRLKMVDKNGTYTVSKIVTVNFEESTEFLTVENPAANGIINLTTNVENAKFNLSSINGKTVEIGTTHMGGDKYVVRVKNAAAGVYLINVTGDKSVITKKVILD